MAAASRPRSWRRCCWAVAGAVTIHSSFTQAPGAGFDELHGIQHGNGAPLALCLPQQPLLLGEHRGIDEHFEVRECCRVREDGTAQRGPIQGAVGSEHSGAKTLDDSGHERAVIGVQRVDDLIAVNDGGALGGEQSRHGALADGYRSGQADDVHGSIVRPTRRSWPSGQQAPGVVAAELGLHRIGQVGVLERQQW